MIILEGSNDCCEKIYFFKRNDTVVKIFVIYLIFDKKLPGREIFHILRLPVLDIYLCVVTPIVLFVQLFDACMIAHGI